MHIADAISGLGRTPITCGGQFDLVKFGDRNRPDLPCTRATRNYGMRMFRALLRTDQRDVIERRRWRPRGGVPQWIWRHEGARAQRRYA
jgi:hypothetical protein